MALVRRLILAISAVFILLLAANMVVSLFNSQTYFADQMRALAEDTATSLGFSLSHAAEDKDTAQIQSMIDVIFDRGYFLTVRYTTLDGTPIAERTRTVDIERVPHWFVSHLSLPAPSGTSEVMSGWMRLGTVQVVSHPGYAYRELWRVFVEQIWLFIFATVVCYGLVGLGLKHLLKPLKDIERQANFLREGNYHTVSDLPSIPEFRNLAEALNKASQKVGTLFLQQAELITNLRKEACEDPLTGLANRTEFDAQIKAWVASEVGGGAAALVIVELDGLYQFNSLFGMEAGDKLMKDIAGIMGEIPDTWRGARIGRRGGAGFSAFIPGVFNYEIEQYIAELKEKIDKLDSIVSAESANESLVGVPPVHIQAWVGASFSQQVNSATKMFSAADVALREAKAHPMKGHAFYYLEEHRTAIRSAGEWLGYLQSVVEEGAIQYQFQRLYDAEQEELPQFEALARVKENQGLINASMFWPLVERYGLTEELDKQAISNAIDLLGSHPNIRLSVNISPHSVVKTLFNRWLVKQKEALQEVTDGNLSPLIIEVSESALRWPKETLSGFIQRAQETGFAVALDHFGNMPASLGSLLSLPLEYVKIDRRYVSNIHINRENQYYVKNLVQIAHNCNVKIYADGVETEDEWIALQGIGVDGGQGYWLEKPRHLGTPKN